MDQRRNIFEVAIIGCVGWGICHGLRRGSGISGISTDKPPTSSAISRIEFKKRNRSVSSMVWALRMLFADSVSAHASSLAFMFSTSFLFAPCNLLTSSVKSSSCFCFLIRDRRADSRFDSILFRFLSSICGSPASDPELVAERWIDAISDKEMGFDLITEQKKMKANGNRNYRSN